MAQQPQGFFRHHQRLLLGASTVYVAGLIVSHSTLPSQHVWWIAAFFSIAMNATYVIEAVQTDNHRRTETTIACSLILLSILGLILSPLWVIAAIFGHGCWDLAKHAGHGVPFLSWYVLGCVVVDWCYSAALLVYLLQ